MNKVQLETYVQGWINKNWHADRSDYQNTEDMLMKLNRMEQNNRGTRSREEAEKLNAIYERVQFMRELALKQIGEGGA